ncbi:MAG: acyltransferase [Clostridia bacterium]|nr:acyltransferase [Clostridia bacterium]
MKTSFYTETELKGLGLKHFGKNVLISRKASIYQASKISIGNNVRIDDFCILSGLINFGNNIHLASYSALFGGSKGIYIGDFANISSRVCIYALSDDYSGDTMTNPTIPDIYKNIESISVNIEKHVIIGSGCTVLPGVTLAEGTAIGAMSLCKESTEPWKIYAGIPIRCIKDRSKKLLDLEQNFNMNQN